MLKLQFTHKELSAVSTLTVLYALRIFGLFLLYPVLSVYASGFEHSTPLLVGAVFGIYGLMQVLLQFPMGVLSDRIGRSRVVMLGLGLFVIGSFVAGLSTDIYGLLFGRALQGAGAISAVLTAWLADIVHESRRSQAMAVIGITIGMTFSLSLVLSPLLTSHMGVSGVFILLAFLGMLALCLSQFIPQALPLAHAMAPITAFKEVTKDRSLLRLAFSVGLLHVVLTSMFIVIPGQLLEMTGLGMEGHAPIYAAAVFISLLLTFPMLGLVERHGWQKPALLLSIAALGLAQWILMYANTMNSFLVGLITFFLAFNWLEASLPSWMSRVAPAHARGAAMGVFSTCQFLGMFIGGMLSGFILKYHTINTLYCVLAWVILLWLMVCLHIKPLDEKTETIAIQHNN
jgi:MFS family permease